VEARRAFINLDLVKIDLVKGVCFLAVKTQQFVKGKLNKQTSAFIRASMAYCYITIPSIELYFERLYLYVISAQVAILNQSLAQADSLFKAAIQLIRDIPRNMEERDGKAYPTTNDLINYLKYFVGVLIAVPGHPDNGAFYLLKGFVKAIKEYDWEPKSPGKIQINTAILVMLSTQYQKKLPYEWDKVESNTLLYGHTESYLSSIRDYINEVIKDIREDFERLNQYADGISQGAQAQAAWELTNAAICCATLSPALLSFISEYYKRSKRVGPDKLQLTIDYAKTFAARGDDQNRIIYTKLVKTLEDLKKE